MTPEEKFAALRAAGLKHNDLDIVRMFDTSTPDWVAKARAAKPDFFHDALTASKAEADRRMGDIVRDNYRRRADLRQPTPGFDAMAASTTEYAAECRRMRIS